MPPIRKLTLNDLFNLKRRETKKKVEANPGDLIKIYIDNQEIIVIVISMDENSLEVNDPSGKIKWISRFVKYKKI